MDSEDRRNDRPGGSTPSPGTTPPGDAAAAPASDGPDQRAGQPGPSAPPPSPAREASRRLKAVRALLSRAMLRDQSLALRRMAGLRRRASGRSVDARLLRELEDLERTLRDSARERERRACDVPAFSYPRELPITARKDAIVRAIRRDRVVIVAGETGCGKSTQIPKMCLEAGRGVAGRIAVTQPRRIAAVTIAGRIAEELREEVGRSVGYKIRFQDRTSPRGYVKVLTDGMLLAEAQADRRLTEYDTIIIDEAHERSLNIDFLIGIARLLLDVRPELRLVITSATLDIEKFRAAFPDAPVVEVSGRTYPVDVEYRPALDEDADDWDYVDDAVEAVGGLRRDHGPGDVLVFMPTEMDILETVQKLEGKHYPGVTVLPLFARLPSAQQGRVYSVTGPKIVVATNVAETSLTIPGIKYVVDTGLARIAQYQAGSHINALPVRPISRASADQRKGRCGRVQAGVCVRLYSEEDYESRPEFTPPEILRSDLAEVVLRMLDLRLGDPLEFPFIDRPTARAVHDGYETLFELGAIRKASHAAIEARIAEAESLEGGPVRRPHRESRRGDGNGSGWELTERGRTMARMPLDPRVSRMLLEAAREGVIDDTAAIAAALSLRDPRERPPDKTQQADQVHAAFAAPGSDFLTLLNLWNSWSSDATAGSTQNQRRKYCRDNFLSYPRMREWGFLHQEILAILDEQRIGNGGGRRDEGRGGGRDRRPADDAPAAPSGGVERSAAIHRSIVSGLISNIAAQKEKYFYNAAKNREVMLWPGSVLFPRPPAWIVAAEIVRTTRLYARAAGRIDPAWLEALGGDLCRRTYAEPAWDRGRGEVVAKERVTLFGLEIVRDRRVSYRPINPKESHEIFVRCALVEGDMSDPPAFLRHNLEVQRKVAAMEDKLRRRDLKVSDDLVTAFYSDRLPGVADARTLQVFVREHGDETLKLREEDLLKTAPDEAALEGFPDAVEIAGRRFRAVYSFAPGDDADGVTVRVPAPLLGTIPPERLDWGVPGQLRDKIAALVKGLPKKERKLLMPLSDAVEIIAREMPRAADDVPLTAAVAAFVKRRFKADIPLRVWQEAEVPRHLRMRVAATDGTGRVIDAGRDLDVLKRKIGSNESAPSKTDSPAWAKARAQWEREGVTDWDFGTLPESVPAGSSLTAYPALEPADDRARIRLFPAKKEAEASHRRGVRALLQRRFAKDVAFVRSYHRLPSETDAAAKPFGGRVAVEKAIEESLLRDVLAKDIRTEEEYKAYAMTVVRALFETGHRLTQSVIEILKTYEAIRRDLAAAGVPMGEGEEESGGESNGAGARGGAVPAAKTSAAKAPAIGRAASLDALESALEQIRRKPRGASAPPYYEQVRDSLESLAPRDFLERNAPEDVARLPRYLQALKIRLDRARIDPEKDRAKWAQVEPFEDAWRRLRNRIASADAAAEKSALPVAKPVPLVPSRAAARTAPPASEEKRQAVREFRWMVEEFKISFFAPEMKPAFPISAVRLAKRLKEIETLD